MYRFAGIVLCLTILAMAAMEGRCAVELAGDTLTTTDRSRGDQTQTNCEGIADIGIPWPTCYGVQQTGRVSTMFSSNGTFGPGLARCDFDVDQWPTVGFQSPVPDGVEYLFGGAIWIGGIVGQDTLASTGSDGWLRANELRPAPASGGRTITEILSPADFAMRAGFTDTVTAGVGNDFTGRPHIPLNLRIANRSHAWHEPPGHMGVVYDLVITNIGQDTIRQGYVGLYFDPDCGPNNPESSAWDDDLAGSMHRNGIAYVVDNDGDPVHRTFPEGQSTPRAFAFSFLDLSFEATDTTFNWWHNGVNSDFDFGPRLQGSEEHPLRDFQTGGTGYPAGDANAYYMMSFPEWDYDQAYTASILPFDLDWEYPPQTVAKNLTNGWDVRFVMAAGPFDLLPDSTVRVLFTTFTADSIHADPDNYYYLPYYPYPYICGLNLERLVPSLDALRANSKLLLDPTYPPTGCEIEVVNPDSVTVTWDPWGFDGVEGVNIYLSEINPATFPYPGVIPPWYEVDTPVLYAQTGRGHAHKLQVPDSRAVYLLQLAHRTADGVGQLSRPLAVQASARPAAPSIPDAHITRRGDSVVLDWSVLDSEAVDHYNIYRFADSVEADERYPAFYDRGFALEHMAARDTIVIESDTFYYYALAPYATVDGRVTEFSDQAEDGTVYVVTAVDVHGFESEMSALTTAYIIDAPVRDLLILTNSNPSRPQIASYATIEAFYDSVLAGLSLEYDIVSHWDSCYFQADCPSFRGLAAYRTVIIDDVLQDQLPDHYNESVSRAFTRYLESGGRLVYFGGFRNYLFLWISADPGFRSIEDDFVSRFFAIDSVFYIGLTYYRKMGLPLVDSLSGFALAESVEGDLPSLDCDTAAYPLAPDWATYWPVNTPPSISAFGVRPDGIVTHRYRSLYPSSSLVEGCPVGVKTVGEHFETYLFGFHLYYMTRHDARSLISEITGADCCGMFTGGYAGNVNCDSEGKRNLVDLARLIDHLYISRRPLCCRENGNTTGDPEGRVTIADIARLVDHIYVGHGETAACR